MKLRPLPFLALALFIACSSKSSSKGLFDGDVKGAGFVQSGDPTMLLEAKTDESGNAALSVSGSGAPSSIFSLPIDPNDGAANSIGITFRIRGSDAVRFSVSTLGTIPTASGGQCAENCVLHGTDLAVAGEWVTITLRWSDLHQAGVSPEAPLIAGDIKYLNWEIQSADAYNIWLDDVAFIYDESAFVGGSGGSTSGTGGAATTGGAAATGGASATGGGAATGGASATGGSTSTNNLEKYVDQAMFLSSFPYRNPLYTYSKLLEVVEMFPDFASCCSEDDKKREIAAFLANVQHEADGLKATDEYTPPSTYCNPASQDQYGATIGCAGGQDYHGRGALQITWNYNYKFAETSLAAKGKSYNLWANPAQVSSDSFLLWATAMWFWMEGDPSYTNPAHSLINSQGFGATIGKINGGLECGQAVGSDGYNKMLKRVEYFKAWCDKLGVSYGNNLTC